MPTALSPVPSAVEVKLRGRTRLISDTLVHERYSTKVAADLGWTPVVGKFLPFAVDITDVTQIGFDPGTHGQHVVRWPEGTEYIRPATSTTTLGPRQPVSRTLR